MGNDHMETNINNLLEVYGDIENLHDKGYLSDEEYNAKNNQLLRNLMAIITLKKNAIEKSNNTNDSKIMDNNEDKNIIKVCIAKLRNLVSMLDVNQITSDEFIERVKLVLKDLVINIKNISLFFIESYLDPNKTYIINRRYAEYIKDSSYAKMMYDNGLKESNVNKNDRDKKYIADIYESLVNIPNPQEYKEVDVSNKFKNDVVSNDTNDSKIMDSGVVMQNHNYDDSNIMKVCMAKMKNLVNMFDIHEITSGELIERIKLVLKDFTENISDKSTIFIDGEYLDDNKTHIINRQYAKYIKNSNYVRIYDNSFKEPDITKEEPNT